MAAAATTAVVVPLSLEACTAAIHPCTRAKIYKALKSSAGMLPNLLTRLA